MSQTVPTQQPPNQYASSGYAPQPSNGLGLAGFIVSMVGIVITGGLLCPIGVLMSGIAVFKPPRGFAIAGLIVGVIGSVMGVMLGVMVYWAVVSATSSFQQLRVTGSTYLAEFDIDSYYTQHGELPDDATGSQLIAANTDPWGQPLEYRKLSSTDYELISSGPDMQVGTADDLVSSHVVSQFGGGAFGQGSFSIGQEPAFEQIQTELRNQFGAQSIPTAEQAEPIISRYQDQWGNAIEYRPIFEERFLLNSPGPDGKLGTADDLSFVGSMSDQ